MKRDEVIQRFCALQEEVSGFIGHQYAADCFCGKGGFWATKDYSDDDYRNDGKSLEFIETAVREKLERCKQAICEEVS